MRVGFGLPALDETEIQIGAGLRYDQVGNRFAVVRGAFEDREHMAALTASLFDQLGESFLGQRVLGPDVGETQTLALHDDEVAADDLELLLRAYPKTLNLADRGTEARSGLERGDRHGEGTGSQFLDAA